MSAWLGDTLISIITNFLLYPSKHFDFLLPLSAEQRQSGHHAPLYQLSSQEIRDEDEEF